MGQEAKCKAKFGNQSSEGQALLESDHVLFRGSFRRKILFRDLKSATASSGALTLVTSDGTTVLELGPQADRWVQKILNPPSRLQKLGVKPGMTVALIGNFDESFAAELESAEAVRSSGKAPCDMVFLACPKRNGLQRLETAIPRLKTAAGLWVVYPKGIQDITEMEVLTAGRAAGLKDTKVASFSTTHTALRFVIPLADRATR